MELRLSAQLVSQGNPMLSASPKHKQFSAVPCPSKHPRHAAQLSRDPGAVPQAAHEREFTTANGDRLRERPAEGIEGDVEGEEL